MLRTAMASLATGESTLVGVPTQTVASPGIQVIDLTGTVFGQAQK